VVRALITGSEGLGLKACAWDFLETPSFHPAVNGYPDLFRAGKDEGGEQQQ